MPNDPYANNWRLAYTSGTDQSITFNDGTVGTGGNYPKILLVLWSGTAQGTLTIQYYRGGSWYAGEAANLTTAAKAYYFQTHGCLCKLVGASLAGDFEAYAALVPGV